jgi:phosphoribosylcarboxyaminoimidazole (NCAIR) mutase
VYETAIDGPALASAVPTMTASVARELAAMDGLVNIVSMAEGLPHRSVTVGYAA